MDNLLLLLYGAAFSTVSKFINGRKPDSAVTLINEKNR